MNNSYLIYLLEVTVYILFFFIAILYGMTPLYSIYVVCVGWTSIRIANILLNKVKLSQKVSMFLLLGLMIRMLFVLFNYQWSITTGSIDNPNLSMVDSKIFHTSALLISTTESNILGFISVLGYPLILSLFYQIFSPNILVGMLLNLLVGITNIALIGIIGFLLFGKRQVAGYSILFASVSPILFSFDAVISKDPIIVTGVALTVISMLGFSKGLFNNSFSFGLLIIGFIILSTFRPILLLVPLALFIIVQSKMSGSKKVISTILVLMSFSVGFYLANRFTREGINLSSYATMEQNKDWENQGIMSYFDGFASWPIYLRSFVSPIFAGIQYLLPIGFWNLNFDVPYDFGRRVGNIIWLLGIGPIWIFSIISFKKLDHIQKSFLFIGLFLYFVLATITAGAQSRYVASIMPLIIPCAAGIFSIIQTNNRVRKRWHGFYLFYILIGIISVCLYALIKL